MEMCSKAKQLTLNVGFVYAFDHHVQHFAALFENAGDDRIGIAGFVRHLHKSGVKDSCSSGAPSKPN